MDWCRDPWDYVAEKYCHEYPVDDEPNDDDDGLDEEDDDDWNE